MQQWLSLPIARCSLLSPVALHFSSQQNSKNANNGGNQATKDPSSEEPWPDILSLLKIGGQELLNKPLACGQIRERVDEEMLNHCGNMSAGVLTRIQQVGIFITKSLVGQEVVAVSVERHEWHHVVSVVVADGGIGTWVAALGRLVSPEPALIDAAYVTEKRDQARKQRLQQFFNFNLSSIQQLKHLSMKAW